MARQNAKLGKALRPFVIFRKSLRQGKLQLDNALDTVQSISAEIISELGAARADHGSIITRFGAN